MADQITLLTIDDDEPMRRSVRGYFEDLDFRVLEARDGNAGLEAFRREDPDMVLVDLRMPGLGGLDVIQVMAREAPEIPLVVLSGTGVIGDAIDAIRKGAWDFVTKPIRDVAELQQVVSRVLERARLRLESRRYQEHLEREVARRTSELTEINDRLRAIVQSTRTVAACSSVQEVSNRLLEEFASNMAAEGGSIYLVEDSALVLKHCLDEGHTAEQIPLPAQEDSPIRKALDTMQPLVIRDFRSEKGLRPSGWSGYRDPSMLVFPLLDDRNKPIGVITLHNKTNPPFTEQDGELGKILASYSCEAIRSSRAMEALRLSEERYRQFFESTPTPTVIHSDGKILFLNPAAVTLYGARTPEELIGRPMVDFVKPESRSYSEDRFKRTQDQGQPVPFRRTTIVRFDGTERIIESAAVPVTFKGKPAVQSVGQDITEEVTLQKQLLQAQKMEAIGTLAGGIAHDFNNLLQAILGYSDLLLMKKGPGDPDRTKLEIIRNTARDGADLVSRILTFSRKADSRARPIDLNEEVRKAYRLMRRTVSRMIEIELTLEDPLHVIDADPAQVEQVLLNLAVNSQHAMPEGGRIVIETSNVSLSDAYTRPHIRSERAQYVLLAFSDNGIGIEPEFIDRIYEPFFTTKCEGEGTGLGLAMVHGIVSQHGGDIGCYSEPGIGTSFQIYFPVSATELISDLVETREMPAFGSETILLVDDDDRVREAARQMIELGGYKVITAGSGEDALQEFADHRHEISLVILDLIMPGMGGSRCLQELLQSDPAVNVLIASGYSSIGLSENEHGRGAKGFVSKPYDAKDILAAIRKVLDLGEWRAP